MEAIAPRWKWTALAAVLAVAFFSAACGPGGGGDTDPEPPPEPGNIFVDLKIRPLGGDWTDGTAVTPFGTKRSPRRIRKRKPSSGGTT